MVILSFWVAAATSVVFAFLAVVSIWRARSEGSARVRWVLVALAAASIAFTLSAAFRALLLSARAGWIDDPVRDVLISAWALGQLVAALGFGIAAIFVLKKGARALSQGDRLQAALGDRFMADASIERYGLTDRELEVLEAIGMGRLSDRDLGRLLFISPTTAATHVKRILRKTGLTDRRDLVLLVASADERTRRGNTGIG